MHARLISLALFANVAAAEEPIRHAFLAADPRAGRVALVDEDGVVGWTCAAKDVCDATVLADGTVLLSDRGGARIVTRKGQVVWDYRAPKEAEVYTCQMLSNGNVLVCEGGTKRLVEVNREGTVVVEIPLVTGIGVHGQFRIARKLPGGTYLVAFWKEGCVKEIAADGSVRRTIGGLGEAYMARHLPNGNTLIGCGDTHRVVEVDPAGAVVWEVNENDLPGHPLRFAAHVERLANGNTMICNWPGHGYEGKQPLLVEVTPDKRVVWQFDGRDRFRGIIGLQLLDGGGKEP
jgi:outer membrane protein assembly factor BamB